MAFAAVLAAMLTSCGYPPPMPGSPTAPRQVPVPDTVAVTPPPRSATPSVAAVDSTPSLDALRVLASIPDPLTPEERMVPREDGALPPLLSGTAPDTSGVPVPAPTAPLGSRPRVTAIVDSALTTGTDSTQVQGSPDGTPVTGSDTTTGAIAAQGDTTAASLPPDADSPPAASTPAILPPVTPDTAAAAPPAGQEPDPCWRVQIAAPSTRDAAETKRRAGESLLLLPMVIEVERGLYKVRSKPCMDRPAIEALRDRARAAGFEGAFPVRRK